MSLGKNLSKYRKMNNFSQEELAFQLGVSRQTISKWEQNEVVPNINQVKKLSEIYHIDLDVLVDDDQVMKEIKEVMNNTNFKNVDNVNWTNVWSKKYPVLGTYQEIVDVEKYGKQIRQMFEEI